MRTNKTWILGALLGVVAAHAQQDLKQQDQQAIKAMCGCYEVDFIYSETFSPEADYEKKPDYRASGLEWVELIEDRENRISLQHLLVVKDSAVIKHWRQDWEYEAPASFEFQTAATWNFFPLPGAAVRGTWTQKVYQVDDSPRYAGTATWIHADGKHYWENTAPSPLPRREYTKRSDYNLMLRGNRHEITPEGWVHEQDNQKIVRQEGGKDLLVAEEKGRNTYRKVEDSKCTLARAWWQENQGFWADVRTAWQPLYEREGSLTLQKTVEGKPLYLHLKQAEAQKAGVAELTALFSRFARAEGISGAGK
jgi:hypothetical protein